MFTFRTELPQVQQYLNVLDMLKIPFGFLFEKQPNAEIWKHSVHTANEATEVKADGRSPK